MECTLITTLKKWSYRKSWFVSLINCDAIAYRRLHNQKSTDTNLCARIFKVDRHSPELERQNSLTLENIFWTLAIWYFSIALFRTSQTTSIGVYFNLADVLFIAFFTLPEKIFPLSNWIFFRNTISFCYFLISTLLEMLPHLSPQAWCVVEDSGETESAPPRTIEDIRNLLIENAPQNVNAGTDTCADDAANSAAQNNKILLRVRAGETVYVLSKKYVSRWGYEIVMPEPCVILMC